MTAEHRWKLLAGLNETGYSSRSRERLADAATLGALAGGLRIIYQTAEALEAALAYVDTIPAA